MNVPLYRATKYCASLEYRTFNMEGKELGLRVHSQSVWIIVHNNTQTYNGLTLFFTRSWILIWAVWAHSAIQYRSDCCAVTLT